MKALNLIMLLLIILLTLIFGDGNEQQRNQRD